MKQFEQTKPMSRYEYDMSMQAKTQGKPKPNVPEAYAVVPPSIGTAESRYKYEKETGALDPSNYTAAIENTMDGIQTALDFAGMAPVVGIVADAANTVLYLAHGKYGFALLSAYSAIPMVGLSGPIMKGLLKSFKGKKLSALLKLLKELLEKINLKKMLDGVDSLIDTLVDGAKRASKAMKETLEKIKDKMVKKAGDVKPRTKVNVPESQVIESGAVKRVLPGTEGIVTGGDSTKLGKNMMESMGLPRGTKWAGHQAQHIIPSEMARHPVIQKIGMDIDDASNGLFLRTPADDISTMSRHRGYHSTYNEFVKTQLDGMDIKQSVDVLQKQVYDLQQKLKYLQHSGLPLYPSQGATVDLWQRSLDRIK